MTNDIHALSGAYAVDALDDIERAAFERHLAECAECRAEVASLREAAAPARRDRRPTAPPPALRDRVLAGIATVRPLPPEVPRRAAPARRRRPAPLRGLVAAAAAVVVVGAGAVVVAAALAGRDLARRPSATDAVLQAPRRPQHLARLPGRRDGDRHPLRLGRQGGHRDRARCRRRRTGMVYQLWLDQPGDGMVSAGVMPVEGRPDRAARRATPPPPPAPGITVEPEGGSTAPTTEPIALFDFGEKA